MVKHAVLAAALTVAAALSAEEARLAVLDFKSIGVAEDAGAAASELLCTELSLASDMKLVERSALKRLIQERQFQASDWTDTKVATELAKLAGARFVVVGGAVKTGAVLTLTARMIDVGTGEVVRGAKASGRGEEDIPRMCRDLAATLARKEGRGEPITETGAAVPTPDGEGEAGAIADALRKVTERLRASGLHAPVLRFTKDGQTVIGEKLFLLSQTTMKNFVAEKDVILLHLQTPAGVKRARVEDFVLKNEPGDPLTAKELREYLTGLGFEISPPRRTHDDIIEVTLTHWLK